ncbi:MAG: replication-relaxation family protein [Magnetospiraceae bacterium]
MDVPDHLDSLSRRKRTRLQSTGKRVTPQERDILWFSIVHRHGPLPSSFLHAFSKNLRRSEKRAKDRLTDLFNEARTPHGGPYLSRPLQQFRTIDSRYNDLVYDLTPASEAALKERDLWHEANANSAGPWLHRFMVACITASIELATLARNNIRFIPQADILSRAGAELRYPTTITNPKTGRTETRDLIPDALFGLEYRKGGQSYYRFFVVEADRGTEPTTSTNFNRKSHLRGLLQYRDYIGNGRYRKHLGLKSSLLALNVLTEATKMKKMMALTERISGSAGNSYMLYRTVDAFGLAFKPPKPMPELLEGPWKRAGKADFGIDRP